MPEWKVIIPDLLEKTDYIQAVPVLEKVIDLSFTLQFHIIDNINVGIQERSRWRLHLNKESCIILGLIEVLYVIYLYIL